MPGLFLARFVCRGNRIIATPSDGHCDEELRIASRGLVCFISRARMKKYLHVIGIGIQNNLTYRVNYLSRTLFSFIPLFAMLSLWRTIYGNKNDISGYTQAQMIFYYLLVAVVDVF